MPTLQANGRFAVFAGGTNISSGDQANKMENPDTIRGILL
jgi:hypothetical protein